MKKVIKIFLIIIVLIILSKLCINFITNEHNVSYTITTNKKEYLITESFKKENNNHTYSFTVKNKNKVYTFSSNIDLKKDNKIITEIKYYKSNSLECILPIYINNTTSNIACLLDNKQVSYSYLKQINNEDINKILDKIKKLNYKVNSYKVSKSLKQNDFISVYSDNIPKDYIYTIWFYKGIYIVDNEEIIKKQLLKNDQYENELSMLVGNYYVTFNTDDLSNNLEYQKVIIYNLKTKKEKELTLKDKLSINTYINGVYNNELYITDNDTKKQYVLDPNKKAISEIGNKKLGYKTLENNKLINIKTANNNLFDYSISNKKLEKLYKNIEIKESNENYYFKTKEGKVYKVVNKEYEHPILLFEFSSIKEWKVKDDIISFIVDDTIYSYTDTDGLRPIIIDKELKYNYKNIYDFMKK